MSKIVKRFVTVFSDERCVLSDFNPVDRAADEEEVVNWYSVDEISNAWGVELSYPVETGQVVVHSIALTSEVLGTGVVDESVVARTLEIEEQDDAFDDDDEDDGEGEELEAAEKSEDFSGEWEEK